MPTARAFLTTLGAPSTLVLSSNDADVGYPPSPQSLRFRGHGVTIATNLVAATPPPSELHAHHRTFGLGAPRLFCPRPSAGGATLAELVLQDADLIARIRADRTLTDLLVSYKSPHAARMIDTLGLTPVFCDPAPAAYERANDKLALARAGSRYGFATLPIASIADEAALTARFDELAAHYGEGCIVRLRRGASGSHVHHAPTLRAARRIWRRLAAAAGEVLLVPYLPSTMIRRNVASHGIVTPAGFAPFFFTDQLIRGHRFQGGHAVDPWSPADVTAIRTGLDGVARWFRDVGYCGAPAGVDGFLIDEAGGPRFVVIDPNARLSATTVPWAAVTVLTERAGRPLVWQFEGFRLLGFPFTLARLRRHLGADLLAPERLEQGGILPTFLAASSLGPAGACHLWTLLLGHDADHVAHLRRRVRGLGLIAR